MPLDPGSIALVVAGVLAVVIAIVWRNASHQRRLALVARALADPDADARIDAARHLVSTGLDRAAPILLETVATEGDDRVLAAIALAVLQRQWEPNGSVKTQKLRWWAGRELDRQGVGVDAFPAAFTRLSDMGGPRMPAPNKPGAEGAESTEPVENVEKEVAS